MPVVPWDGKLPFGGKTLVFPIPRRPKKDPKKDKVAEPEGADDKDVDAG